MDANSGEFLALMDGTWITAMRTGAVAAHSVLLFAKTGFSTIGIMGLGNVVRSTLSILADKLPDRELHIKLLKYKSQEDLAMRFANTKNFHFSFVDTPEEMVKVRALCCPVQLIYRMMYAKINTSTRVFWFSQSIH